jgi:hypothetical protein
VTRWLAFLLVAGCSGSVRTVSSESALSEATAAAVEAWRPVLSGCGRTLTVVPSDADARVEFGSALGNPGAERSDGLILVEPAEPDYLWPLIIAHELGHALGASDTTDRNDIMCDYLTTSTLYAPSEADRRQVCGQPAK